MARCILCIFCLLALAGCSTSRAGFSGPADAVDGGIDTFVKAGPPKDAGFASDNSVDSQGGLDALSLDSTPGMTIDTIVSCAQQAVDNGYANVKQGQMYYVSCDSCKTSVYSDAGLVITDDAGSDLEIPCIIECKAAVDCIRDHWPCSTSSCVTSCTHGNWAVGRSMVNIVAPICCPVIGAWASASGC
jgi:hypothetical protein